MDSNQILLTNEDRKICFLGGSEMPKISGKIEKSWYLCNRLTDFDEIW